MIKMMNRKKSYQILITGSNGTAYAKSNERNLISSN